MSEPLDCLALVAPGPGLPASVERVLVDPPGSGEVRVRMLASGVCHTDLMVTQGVWWSDHPYVLGHEGIGVAESVGDGVAAELVGRRVLLAWRSPCGACRFCARGDARLCVDLQRASGRIRSADGGVVTPSLRLGTHATYAVVAAGQAIPVPDDASPAALCTIGCAVMTGVGAVVNTNAVRPGDRVAVLGCGGVGLSVVQGARMVGASVIVAVDRRQDKLDAARRFGATHTIRSVPGEDAAEQIRAATGGLGVDHAFEAVGSGEVVGAAVRSCDIGGTATIIGTPDRTARLDLAVSDVFFSRLTVRVSQYGDAIPDRDFPMLVAAYQRGDLLLDELVSREIDLAEAPAALAALETGDVLRSVIRFDQP